MLHEDLINKRLEIFLTKYRDNLKDIHYKLFNIPDINIRTSSYTILCKFIPWWFIILLIKFGKLRTKSKIRIGIFKHNLLKPFYFLGDIKNNNLISSFLFFALKIIAYKVLTSFIYKKIYIKTIKEIGFYISGNFQSILLPHDTYPETFFITQLLKEFKGASSVCIQHGLAERIFKNPENISLAIQDGMNSDIFLSFDIESANYMKKLLNKKSHILKNKNLKIIILNCFRKFHEEGIIKSPYINSLKNTDVLSIIFIQVAAPNTKTSKIYDEYYLGLIPYLKNFYKGSFKKLRFIYKSRDEKSFPKLIKEAPEIELVYKKEYIFSLISNNLVFTGFTTLAYELREAGFYIIGIKKNDRCKEIFPSYIFNKLITINQLTKYKSNSKNFSKLPNKEFLKNYKPNKNLSCFTDQKCIDAEKITNNIFEMHKELLEENQ